MRTRLEESRKAAGLSQTKLAAACGLQASDISKLENGWMLPRPNQAARLAEVLKLQPDELLQPAEQ